MNEIQQLLEELLVKTGTLDKNGVAALFNADGSLQADALTQLLNADKARIATITTLKHDEGYGKAKREERTAFEREMEQKFGVKPDGKKGLDYVEAVIAAKTPKATGEITDEQVSRHKLYLDLQENVDKKVAQAVEAVKAEHHKYKQQVERTQITEAIQREAKTLLVSMRPVLSADPRKAENQMLFLLNDIAAGNYRIENGRTILLDDKGGDKVDEHGKRIDFAEYVKETAAKYYDFEAGEAKGLPGNAAGGHGNGIVKFVVRDEADFQKQYLQLKDGRDKAELTRIWEARKAEL